MCTVRLLSLFKSLQLFAKDIQPEKHKMHTETHIILRGSCNLIGQSDIYTQTHPGLQHTLCPAVFPNIACIDEDKLTQHLF